MIRSDPWLQEGKHASTSKSSFSGFADVGSGARVPYLEGRKIWSPFLCHLITLTIFLAPSLLSCMISTCEGVIYFCFVSDFDFSDFVWSCSCVDD